MLKLETAECDCCGKISPTVSRCEYQNIETYACDECRAGGNLDIRDDPKCPDCGFGVDDQGYTNDPRGCCFYCKAD